MPPTFHTSFGLELSLPQVVREIVRFITADPTRRYKVTIGTDSEQSQSRMADFVTAIVVHRVGNGGRYFWRRTKLGKFHTLRDRIIKEVLISLEAAESLLTLLRTEAKHLDWSFEVHADVGENGETKVLIQELGGMIRANNYEARTKPDSYAASKVADRHV